MRTTVAYNVENPEMVLVNAAVESFSILSAVAAQFANVNYFDWFSFSYWLGDLFYRFLAVDNTGFFT